MATPVVDVSVIVPVYNTIGYLRECIDSLVDQTIGHDRFEVLAVDDGSTDGSGELLDEYAASYPGLIRVIHQENSGGPARPCNVALGHATGRFVFFLGSDDHLGTEALERMVAKADEWESDVVCVKLVGTEGREIAQALFATNEREIEFPDQRPWLTANTKLFRRSVLEEHGVRYREDIRVASDQTFTVEAMYRSSRVSVLGDYVYYFAKLREDSSNLMFATGWAQRLDAIESTMDYIADLIAEPEIRDAVLFRHFRWEYVNKLTAIDGFPAEERHEVLRRTKRAVDRHLTPYLADMLPAVSRVRLAVARTGDLPTLQHLNQLVSREITPRLTSVTWEKDVLRIGVQLAIVPTLTDPRLNLAVPGVKPTEGPIVRALHRGASESEWIAEVAAADVAPAGPRALRFGFDVAGEAYEVPIPIEQAIEVGTRSLKTAAHASIRPNDIGRAVLRVELEQGVVRQFVRIGRGARQRLARR